MDPVEAIFLTLKAKYDGDIGLGGLRDKSQDAHVGLFIDTGDLNKATESSLAVVVNTAAIQNDSSQSVRSFSGIVTLQVRTPIAGGRARDRGIVARLETLLDKTALADKGSYKFRPAHWIGSQSGQSDGTVAVRNCQMFISGNL